MVARVILLCLMISSATSSNFVKESFKDREIVPDVIPRAPNKLVKVKYPSGAVVRLGNELLPSEVQDEPTASWPACPRSYYTLAMTDPDVPSRDQPSLAEFNHWIVGNIPGQDVDSGEILAAYIGSAPPEGTGLHRYVFLVYKQKGIIEFDEPRLLTTSQDNRTMFSIADFAKKYKLGDPDFGNYFEAQFES